MTSQPGYQHGDRIALVRTGDPGTRLRPGDEGTVTRVEPCPGPAAHRLGLGQHPDHAATRRRRPDPPPGPPPATRCLRCPEAYLAAARDEFWLEAARLARRRLDAARP